MDNKPLTAEEREELRGGVDLRAQLYGDLAVCGDLITNGTLKRLLAEHEQQAARLAMATRYVTAVERGAHAPVMVALDGTTWRFFNVMGRDPLSRQVFATADAAFAALAAAGITP